MKEFILQFLAQPAIVEWVKQSPWLLLALVLLSLLWVSCAKWLHGLKVLVSEAYRRRCERLKKEGTEKDLKQRAETFVDNCWRIPSYRATLLLFSDMALGQIQRRFDFTNAIATAHLPFFTALGETGLASAPHRKTTWWLEKSDTLRTCLRRDSRVQAAMKDRATWSRASLTQTLSKSSA